MKKREAENRRSSTESDQSLTLSRTGEFISQEFVQPSNELLTLEFSLVYS
jgi:hypothetical protein